MKYHIEKNTVQETLIIPLFGRLICSERFPALFSDPEAKRICDSLDYDFSEKRRLMESPPGLFGALEVAQRQYDLRQEVEAYLKDHPNAAVVNLGCGLDDTFRKCDNGLCRGYNIDMPDVIRIRNDFRCSWYTFSAVSALYRRTFPLYSGVNPRLISLRIVLYGRPRCCAILYIDHPSFNRTSISCRSSDVMC